MQRVDDNAFTLVTRFVDATPSSRFPFEMLRDEASRLRQGDLA